MNRYTASISGDRSRAPSGVVARGYKRFAGRHGGTAVSGS